MQKTKQNGHESKNGLQKFVIASKERPKRFNLNSLFNLYERKKRWFLDLIWPTSPHFLLYFNIFWLVWFLRQNETKNFNVNSDQLIPNWLEKSILSSQLAILSFIAFVIIRQLAIRHLLSYHGWLYGNKSIVQIWGILMKILLFSSAQKGFFSSQRILPRLFVPSLKDTFNRLIESQKGIISDEELEKLEIDSNEFIQKIGWKLQLFLVIKSWFSRNYITNWWGDFVYLRSRESIAITSNVAGFGQSYWTPTNSQVVRASVLTHLLVRFKREIDHGKFSPVSIAQTIPLCSHFYRQLFSTTRIPGPEIDQIQHYPPHLSKHIAVISPQGFIYKLPVFDSNYKLLEPRMLQKGFEWIIKDSEVRSRKLKSAQESESSRSLPSLTTLPRSKWAELRGKYLIGNELNAKSLDLVESSIICLVLSSSDLPNLKAHTYLMSLADGKSIWYDKSLNFIISKDARTGFNLEHSVTDGSQIAHVWEQILSEESTSKFYTEQGECMPFPKSFNGKPGIISQPEYLQWEISPEFELEINGAVKFSQEQNEDIDMYSYDFDDFGKDEMKNIKISPDAFFQSAIGLAYYKDQGKLPNTYEPTLMRLFANGRTETVRSTTLNLKNFILGMDNKELSKGQKIHLFKKSVDSHQKLFKDAMSGKGVDRHLFALYIAGKGLNYDVLFLENILNKPWTLVTSQVPGDQIAKPLDLKHKYFKDKYSMGGIFITTCNEGYGLGYYFGSQTKIFYQVSSKFSCLKTDSKRYSDEISKALKDIMNLFI